MGSLVLISSALWQSLLKNKHSFYLFSFLWHFLWKLPFLFKKFPKSALSFIWERKYWNVREAVHSPRKKCGKWNSASGLSAQCVVGSRPHAHQSPVGSLPGASCLEIALSALIQPSAGAARLWLECRLNRPAFYGNLKTLDIKSTPVYMRVFGEWAIKAVWLAPGCSAFPSPVFYALVLFRVIGELSVLPFVYFQSIIFLTAVCSQQKVIKSMVTT